MHNLHAEEGETWCTAKSLQSRTHSTQAAFLGRLDDVHPSAYTQACRLQGQQPHSTLFHPLSGRASGKNEDNWTIMIGLLDSCAQTTIQKTFAGDRESHSRV